MATQEKKSIVDEIKSELEEMEEKLKKSGEDFRQHYLEKKHKVAALIRKFAHNLEAAGEEKLHDLKTSSEELLDLLEADYDLSYSEFESESHKISKALDSFETNMKDALENLGEGTKKAKGKVEEDIQSALSIFRTERDIQKAHFKGTADRAMAQYDSWKKSRLEDIQSLKAELEVKKSEAGEKLEAFSEELSVSFDHLKKAFSKLW